MRFQRDRATAMEPTRRPIAHPSCPNQKPALDADKNAPETPAHVPSVCVTRSARQDRQVILTTAWQPAALASGLRPLKQCFIDAKNRPLDKRPARREREIKRKRLTAVCAAIRHIELMVSSRRPVRGKARGRPLDADHAPDKPTYFIFGWMYSAKRSRPASSSAFDAPKPVFITIRSIPMSFISSNRSST